MIRAQALRARAATPALIPAAAIAFGCLALATRPLAWRAAWTLLLVGAIGVLGSLPAARAAARMRWLPATALGVAAFVVVRLVEVPVARPFAFAAAGANVLAAIAEEAFFRRYVYGWLARWGAVAAVAGSAALFALVHVPQYGLAVLPIDLAAGALLGWQRWASGTWTAPAATHAVANLLQMG